MSLAKRLTKVAIVIVGVAAAGFWFAPSKPASASGPAADTVSLVGHAPNWFYDRLQGDPNALGVSYGTEAFVDPANNLLFEYNAGASDSAGRAATDCANLVRLDIDSYAVDATDGTGPPSSCAATVIPQAADTSPAAVLAVDPKDRLIFAQIQTPYEGIAAVSEDTLAVRFTFRTTGPGLVSDPTGTVPALVFGLSWYAPADELIAFEGDSTVPGSYGVAAYDAHALVTTAGTSPPLWSAAVPACQNHLANYYAASAVYRTSNGAAVLVPCALVYAGSEERDGVVSIPLQTSGCAVAGHACPSSAPQTVAPAPGKLTDAYFDPGSDRLFMPADDLSGVAMLTFDGDSGAFAGKAELGPESQMSVGLETESGRLYAIGQQTGMTVLDGRVTPVRPGSIYPQYAQPVLHAILTALRPDARTPFRRLLVPIYSNDATPYLLVYADTQTAETNPPPNSVDANTLSGPVPPGATVSSQYSGSAAGYGYHDDFVGGANAVVSNAADGGTSSSAPFSGSSDLLGADVRKLSLDSTNGNDADASALGDGGGATSGEYQQCSGTQAVSCVPPAPCPQSGSGAPCVPAPGQPPVSAGSQPWPFPEAQCVTPGTTSSETTNGLYGSTGGSSAPAPGSDSQNTALATVNCAASNNAASAGAQLGQAQTQAAQLPGVDMGYASSSAMITPSASGGLVTTTTSEATGVSINLGNGVNITIGDVKQVAQATAAGTSGSASTQDLVNISHIYVNGQDLCAAGANNCAAAITEINAQFPTLIKIIERPAADDRYSSNCVADAGNTGQLNCQGSPGGYLSAIEASLGEQYGDQQFNGMSEEESTLLPAMRVILYGFNDGVPSLSRQIIDLAGVLATASQGIQAIPAGTGSSSGGSVTSYTQAGCAACAGVPPSSTVSTIAPTTAGGGIAGTIERILSGLNWLLRNPGEVVQMAAFLALLGLPIMLMRRRWHAGMREGVAA